MDDTVEAGATSSVYAPDTRIAARYRIVRFIAAGGMGEVYEAEDLVLGTQVALKTLRAELSDSDRAIERLRRETVLARKITHPNVCRMFDVGEHEGRVFLTMELLAGDTLASRIPIPLAELPRLAGQLVAALAAAHAAGIVHRDLKPGNVILVGDRAVVTDFGLARSAGTDAEVSLTGDTALLGTPAYMAPEQVEGRDATPASDLYALGVVLYEAATGARPFDEETAMATATARLHKDPTRPRAHRRELDPRWEAIILRCLARDPAARPASAAQVLAPPRRWFGRLAAALALAAAATAVAAAAFVVDDPPPAPPEPSRYWPAGLRPAAPRAAIHVEQAHAALVASGWSDARQLLEQGAAVDRSDPIAHALLAQALDVLGHEDRAVEAIARAAANRDGLDDEAALFVEVIDATVRADPARAVPALRGLVQLAAGDRGYRLRLAAALAETADADEAVLELERLGVPRNDAERIGIALVRAAVARARGLPTAMLGHAEIAAARARTAGRGGDEAEALIVAGAAHWLRGEPAAAARAYQRAVAVGHPGAVVRAHAGLIALDLEGDRIGSAARRYRDTTALVRTLGNRRLLVDLLVDGCWYQMDTGHPDATAGDLAEARQIVTALGDERELGKIELADGVLAQLSGDLDQASRRLEAAYRAGQRLGADGLAVAAIHNWLPTLEELDDPAELARARAMHRSPVERQAESYLALRDDDLDRAERIARGHADRLTYDGREALLVIAHVAIRRGELDEAAARLDEVGPLLVGDGESIVARDRLVRARAELRARRGDLAGALDLLDAQIRDCAAGGLVHCEIQNAGFAALLDPGRAPAVLERARAFGYRRTVRELEEAQARKEAASSP